MAVQQRDQISLAGAPLPVLCITEEWIRERLNLNINSLGKRYNHSCMIYVSSITNCSIYFEVVMGEHIELVGLGLLNY